MREELSTQPAAWLWHSPCCPLKRMCPCPWVQQQDMLRTFQSEHKGLSFFRGLLWVFLWFPLWLPFKTTHRAAQPLALVGFGSPMGCVSIHYLLHSIHCAYYHIAYQIPFHPNTTYRSIAYHSIALLTMSKEKVWRILIALWMDEILHYPRNPFPL